MLTRLSFQISQKWRFLSWTKIQNRWLRAILLFLWLISTVEWYTNHPTVCYTCKRKTPESTRTVRPPNLASRRVFLPTKIRATLSITQRTTYYELPCGGRYFRYRDASELASEFGEMTLNDVFFSINSIKKNEWTFLYIVKETAFLPLDLLHRCRQK